MWNTGLASIKISDSLPSTALVLEMFWLSFTNGGGGMHLPFYLIVMTQ